MKQSLLTLLKKRFPEKKEGELYGYIICGNIFVDDEKVREPARKFDTGAELDLRLKQYVSRGGYKLEGALDAWKIDCRNKVFIDAGSSTGGFTDCLLQKGASLVYAVDVGFNQLDYSLRTDNRVRVHERCNIMDMENLNPKPHMGVADLSFRSISGAAAKIIDLTVDKMLIALIKPQFEIEKEDDFNGVIKDPAVWRKVLFGVCSLLAEEGLEVSRILPSPIKGKRGGNQEFLSLIKKSDSSWDFCKNAAIFKKIDDALSQLKKV